MKRPRFLLLSPCGARNFDTSSLPSADTKINEEFKIDLYVLVEAWLGYKKVSSAGLIYKWWYSGSVNKSFFLSLAQKYMIGFVDSYYIFGKHAEVIIPALCEMEIFERVVTELLENAIGLTPKSKIKIFNLISRQEIDIILGQAAGYESHVLISFEEARQSFHNTVNRSFCQK
jgi:hypothetical protein